MNAIAATYFPKPHPGLSAHLDAFLEAKREELNQNGPSWGVTAMVLGGGYGRGEGGVFVGQDGIEKLYNDLEFYLFCEGKPSAALKEWIHATEQAGSWELQIEP